jgi:predicted metalloprotease with PDZ domain
MRAPARGVVLSIVVAVALRGSPAAAAPRTPAAEYTVQASDGARELRVEAAFTEAPPGGLEFDDRMGRYARDAEVQQGGRWTAATVHEDELLAPACARRGCRVRYRFLLQEAARTEHRRNAVSEQQGALVAPPSTWLVRPADRGRGRYRLRVTTPPGVSFATGVFPTAGAYEADLADLPEAPYSAFGPFETAQMETRGAKVEIALLPGDVAAGRSGVLAWIQRAADDVAGYYGRFPVPRLLVIVIPGGRRAIGFGTTMGNGGASIMVWVGAGAREEDLRTDWVLTHEMVHLGLPNLPHEQRWMEEGLATYVEPIARARHGHLGLEDVWSDLVRRTPQGVPGPGGLDANEGFSAIYWGGALYWLLADVEIRERSGGRLTLEDALGGIRDAGGSIAVTWPVERVLATADRAVGMKVLEDLYRRLARSAGAVDLPALWARLGIDDARGIRFRDDAPLAAIRKAITAAPRASEGGS